MTSTTRGWKWLALGVVTLVIVATVAFILANAAEPKTLPGGMKVGAIRCTEYLDPNVESTEGCQRLKVFGRLLLDKGSHAPVASVDVFSEPSGRLNTQSGFSDYAIVSFKLTDDSSQAFYVRCGAGVDMTLCWDLRPHVPDGPSDEPIDQRNPLHVP